MFAESDWSGLALIRVGSKLPTLINASPLHDEEAGID